MKQLPSCGKRGRCHGEWGSFSCLCEKGFIGPQCDQGEHEELLLIDREVFQEKVQAVLDKPHKVFKPNGKLAAVER